MLVFECGRGKGDDIHSGDDHDDGDGDEDDADEEVVVFVDLASGNTGLKSAWKSVCGGDG